MKFQKDNSDVVLTQKMKDDAIASKDAELAAEAARIKNMEDKIKLATEKAAIVTEIESQINVLMEPVLERTVKYGTIPDQLDRLWHDIDTGRIQADKTSANSWYSTIKSIKDSVPIDKDWLAKGRLLRDQLENIGSPPTANNV